MTLVYGDLSYKVISCNVLVVVGNGLGLYDI